MTTEEQATLEILDRIVKTDDVRASVKPVIDRVREDLRKRPDAVMSWEPIPLSVYRSSLPRQIQSSWVFILRAGTNTGAERHPNSHQRMMSFEGDGDLQTAQSSAEPEAKEVTSETEIGWQSHLLRSSQTAPLLERWVSIPPNVWHRPVVGSPNDWVVVSFHTVPAEELIEERLATEEAGETKQMRYLDTKPA